MITRKDLIYTEQYVQDDIILNVDALLPVEAIIRVLRIGQIDGLAVAVIFQRQLFSFLPVPVDLKLRAAPAVASVVRQHQRHGVGEVKLRLFLVADGAGFGRIA